jgi:hypothetical protein
METVASDIYRRNAPGWGLVRGSMAASDGGWRFLRRGLNGTARQSILAAWVGSIKTGQEIARCVDIL